MWSVLWSRRTDTRKKKRVPHRGEPAAAEKDKVLAGGSSKHVVGFVVAQNGHAEKKNFLAEEKELRM